MDDLISRNAAIKAFTGKPPEYYHTGYIASELRNLPAVDAVLVVRCRDCKHYNINGCMDGFGWCEHSGNDHSSADNWFCADGERRNDDATDRCR